MDPERFRGFSSPELTPQDNFSVLPPPPPHKYGKNSQSSKTKHRGMVISAIVIALIIVVGLGGGYYLQKHHKSTPPPSKPKTSKIAATPTAPAAPTIPSTSYTSVNFNTTFNYPSNWTIVDSGSAPLTVTSPTMQLKAANGSTVLGQIVLTLANKGTMPSAFGTQSVAVMTSQKINFTQPSTSQAAASYISFVQYPTTVTLGGMDAIYLSGNYGYQKDQTIPASNLAAVDPLVYVSFYTCANSQCPITSRQPLTVASTDWNDSSFSAPILIMLDSFAFQ
jgi:hypothetical protein